VLQHAARWKYRTQKWRKKSSSVHHCKNCPAISCIDNRKKVVKQQYLIHMSPTINVGPVAAEIGSGVWGTPANFNGFCVLASLLQRRRSPEANQTLHDAWPFPVLAHYIYILGGSCHLTEFLHVQNSLCVQVLRSPILAALLHCTPAARSAKVCGVVQGMELRNFR